MYNNALNTIRNMSSSSGMKIGFTTKYLSEAVGIMVKGMLGIFAALLIIYVVCIVLQKMFPPNDEG